MNPPLSPFVAHAGLVAQMQAFLGGGNPLAGATLIFPAFGNLVVPCTHTVVTGGSNLIPGGQTDITMVEECEFRAEHMGDFTPRNNIRCDLRVAPDADPLAMQLWVGGLLPGGQTYRFSLVARNYHG